MTDTQEAKHYWSKKLFDELQKPIYKKQAKQVSKAKRASKYRQALISELNAIAAIHVPFQRKVIRRRGA